MNPLNKNLQIDEIVVVSTQFYGDADCEQRAFKCRSGLGMKKLTMDTQIFGEFINDGTGVAIIDSKYIDVADTKEYYRRIDNARRRVQANQRE